MLTHKDLVQAWSVHGTDCGALEGTLRFAVPDGCTTQCCQIAVPSAATGGLCFAAIQLISFQ